MTERLGGAARDTFRSLQIRNFRLFLTGQLISQTGTWLTRLAQVLLVLKLSDGSGVAVGILTACQFLPILFLGAWTGSVADRSDKHRLLIVTQAGAMVQVFVLAGVVFTGHATVAAMYVLALVQGTFTAFDNPARRAFVVEMVPDTLVANAVSLNSAVMTGTRIVGPALAGALVVTVGFGWAFAVDGLSFVAVLTGLLLMRRDELHMSPPVARGKGQVRAGIRYVRSQPDLLVPLVMMAAVSTFAFNFQVTFPLLITGPLGGGEGTFTLLYSVLSVGSMAGALWTARRTEVTDRQIITASTAFGATMLALAASPGLWAAFPVAVLLGVASIIFMTTTTAIVQMRSAPAFRGRVLALQAMVFLGSTPIGGPIMGWISDSAGPRVAIALGGVACVGASVWATRYLRQRGEAELRAADHAATGADEQALTLAD